MSESSMTLNSFKRTIQLNFTHSLAIYFVFFFPQELNIASETTTSQLILALLERLEIIDNHRKFALFELTDTGQEG